MQSPSLVVSIKVNKLWAMVGYCAVSMLQIKCSIPTDSNLISFLLYILFIRPGIILALTC